VIPGEIFPAADPVMGNADRPATLLRIVNTGDRPVQVGSHFHLAEANDALEFDRQAARGLHLDLPAGTSVRFEPGADRDVTAVPYGGARFIAGFRGQIAGPLDA
jgi:urease subunit beta